MPDFKFKREERLKSRKVIEQLFKRGASFAQYPLRIVWVEIEERKSDYPAQFALTVPKKKFKRAVHRNRIRRLVREAYRLNKHLVYEGIGYQKPETRDERSETREQRTETREEGSATSNQIGLMIIYTAQEILPFEEIEQAMRKMLLRFVKKYDANNQQ